MGGLQTELRKPRFGPGISSVSQRITTTKLLSPLAPHNLTGYTTATHLGRHYSCDRHSRLTHLLQLCLQARPFWVISTPFNNFNFVPQTRSCVRYTSPQFHYLPHSFRYMISTFILILLLLWSTMSFLPGVQRLITNALGITSDDSNGSGSSSNSSSHASASFPNTGSSGNAEYEPSALDVVVVKIMLTKGCKLPHEIVLSILDHAEYWPHTTTTLDHALSVLSGASRENQFVVSAASKPYGFVFTNQRLVSFDQNHSG